LTSGTELGELEELVCELLGVILVASRVVATGGLAVASNRGLFESLLGDGVRSCPLLSDSRFRFCGTGELWRDCGGDGGRVGGSG
jgi:hypothetical protein